MPATDIMIPADGSVLHQQSFPRGACCILAILPYQALTKISPLKHALGIIVTAGTDFILRNTHKTLCMTNLQKYENNSMEKSFLRS
jgi:hypothetical protein